MKCIQCIDGRTPANPKRSCTECDAGKFSTHGAAVCVECEAGRFAHGVRQTTCSDCAIGKYTDVGNRSSCIPCPSSALTTNGASAVSVQDCVCKQGFFHDSGHEVQELICALFNLSFNASVCQLCPTGMTCDGLPSSPWAMIYEDSTQVGANFWHRRPTIPKGFMTISQMFFTCFGERTACPGAFMYAPISNMCASGGGGVACSMCPDGTQLRGEARVSCSENIFLHISFVRNGSGCDMLHSHRI